MPATNLINVPPSLEYEEAFRQAHADYKGAGEVEWAELYEPGIRDFDTYVTRLLEWEQGNGLPDGWVPETTRWLITRQGTIAGFIRVRHGLTPLLEEEAGHIGYDVPPNQRRKGYGHACLLVALETAGVLKLPRVLLICDSDNFASRKIIETAGGKLQDEIIPTGKSFTVRRYWLQL